MDEEEIIDEVPREDVEANEDTGENIEEAQEEVAVNDGSYSGIDFGALQGYFDNTDITDISYNNNGQLWIRSLTNGIYRADQEDVDNGLIEGIASQCCELTGKNFNMGNPFLNLNTANVSMSFIHESVAQNGIAAYFRKTSSNIKIRKDKIEDDKYARASVNNFLINCIKGHCNIIVCGENDSGKTELVRYLASNIPDSEKIITIEENLELNLDQLFPTRDIIAMKPNNIANYGEVLNTCMNQNPKWILFSDIASDEMVSAVRTAIASGHHVISTMYADKAESIPYRMYGLLNNGIDVDQFVSMVHRYVQLGVFLRGRYSEKDKKFVREIAGVCEFYVTEDNKPHINNIYLKNNKGEETFNEPSKYIKTYLEDQGISLADLFGPKIASIKDPKAMKSSTTSEVAGKPAKEEEPEVEEETVEETTPEVEETPVEETQEEVAEEPVQEEVQEAPAEVVEQSPTEETTAAPDQPKKPINLIPGIEPPSTQQQYILPPQQTQQAVQPPNLMAGAPQQQGQIIAQPPQLMQNVPQGNGIIQNSGMPQGQMMGQMPNNMIIQQAPAQSSSIIPDMPDMITAVDNSLPAPGSMIPQEKPNLMGRPPLMGNAMPQQQPQMPSASLINQTMTSNVPDTQLTVAPGLQGPKQEKPQLMNRASPKRKPFAKQKFFSGTV